MLTLGTVTASQQIPDADVTFKSAVMLPQLWLPAVLACCCAQILLSCTWWQLPLSSQTAARQFVHQYPARPEMTEDTGMGIMLSTIAAELPQVEGVCGRRVLWQQVKVTSISRIVSNKAHLNKELVQQPICPSANQMSPLR